MSPEARARLRSAVMLLGQQGLLQGLAMGRNILLARMLGPASMGVVSAIALVLTLLEMISDVAVERLLIQTDDNHEDLLPTAHSIQALRGLLAGGLIIALGPVAAWLMDASPYVWAFIAIAPVPMLKGFAHLEIRQRQRSMAFGAMVLVELGAGVIATVAVAVTLWLWASIWAGVIMLVIQAGCTLILSHILGKGRYRFGWKREQALRFWHFGWPLMLNGVLMYLAIQGDRVVVGITMRPEDLGRFTVALTLTLVPTFMLAKVVSTWALPTLSRHQHDRFAFAHQQRQVLWVLSVAALGLAGGVTFLGIPIIHLLYGKAFILPAGVLLAMGSVQALRMLREGLSVTAVALGDTTNPMKVNGIRLLGVVAAFIIAHQGGGVEAILWAGVGGEILAYLAGGWLLYRRHHLALGKTYAPLLPVLAGLLGLGLWPYQTELWQKSAVLALLFFTAVLALQPGWRILNRIRRPGPKSPDRVTTP